MFYVKTMTVKDTMDYSFQVKNCQIKIYTATRRLKLRAGHLQLDARTRANQGTNKATTIYNSHLRDIYPTDFFNVGLGTTTRAAARDFVSSGAAALLYRDK